MSNKQALVAIIVVERNSICLQIYRMIIAYLRAYRHTGRRSSSRYISYNSHVLCVCIEHNAKCCVIARAHKTCFFPLFCVGSALLTARFFNICLQMQQKLQWKKIYY